MNLQSLYLRQFHESLPIPFTISAEYSLSSSPLLGKRFIITPEIDNPNGSSKLSSIILNEPHLTFSTLEPNEITILNLGTLYKGKNNQKKYICLNSSNEIELVYLIDYKAIRRCKDRLYEMIIQKSTSGPKFIINDLTPGKRSKITSWKDDSPKKVFEKMKIDRGKGKDRFGNISDFFGLEIDIVKMAILEIYEFQKVGEKRYLGLDSQKWLNLLFDYDKKLGSILEEYNNRLIIYNNQLENKLNESNKVDPILDFKDSVHELFHEDLLEITTVNKSFSNEIKDTSNIYIEEVSSITNADDSTIISTSEISIQETNNSNLNHESTLSRNKILSQNSIIKKMMQSLEDNLFPVSNSSDQNSKRKRDEDNLETLPNKIIKIDDKYSSIKDNNNIESEITPVKIMQVNLFSNPEMQSTTTYEREYVKEDYSVVEEKNANKTPEDSKGIYSYKNKSKNHLSSEALLSKFSSDEEESPVSRKFSKMQTPELFSEEISKSYSTPEILSNDSDSEMEVQESSNLISSTLPSQSPISGTNETYIRYSSIPNHSIFEICKENPILLKEQISIHAKGILQMKLASKSSMIAICCTEEILLYEAFEKKFILRDRFRREGESYLDVEFTPDEECLVVKGKSNMNSFLRFIPLDEIISNNSPFNEISEEDDIISYLILQFNSENIVIVSFKSKNVFQYQFNSNWSRIIHRISLNYNRSIVHILNQVESDMIKNLVVGGCIEEIFVWNVETMNLKIIPSKYNFLEMRGFIVRGNLLMICLWQEEEKNKLGCFSIDDQGANIMITYDTTTPDVLTPIPSLYESSDGISSFDFCISTSGKQEKYYLSIGTKSGLIYLINATSGFCVGILKDHLNSMISIQESDKDLISVNACHFHRNKAMMAILYDNNLFIYTQLN